MVLFIVLLIVMVLSFLFGVMRRRHFESLDGKEVAAYHNRVHKARIALLVTIPLLFIFEIGLFLTMDKAGFTAVDWLGHYGSIIGLPCLWVSIYWMFKKMAE